MTRSVRTAATIVLMLVGSAATRDAWALTEQQCQYFDVAGRTAICHATSSPNNRYVLLESSTRACVAHANHPFDFVAVDGSCEDAAPLPPGAPCDATLACAEGLSCVAGVCSEQTAQADTSLIPRLERSRSASSGAGFWRMTTSGLAMPSRRAQCVPFGGSRF